MKHIVCITSLLLLLISCHSENQLTNVQREAIVDEVQKMAEKFFIDSDKKNIDAVISYLDTSSAFFWIFPPDSTYITRDELVSALKDEISSSNKVSSKWDKMRIEPITSELVYYQGIFHQIVRDTSGKETKFLGSESAIVILRESGWKFLYGQTFYSPELIE